MRLAEGGETVLTESREGDAHHPVVVGIGGPGDEAGPLGTVDLLDDAVVTQQQVLGHIPYRRR
jgi:hypothetical protein